MVWLGEREGVFGLWPALDWSGRVLSGPGWQRGGAERLVGQLSPPRLGGSLATVVVIATVRYGHYGPYGPWLFYIDI